MEDFRTVRNKLSNQYGTSTAISDSYCALTLPRQDYTQVDAIIIYLGITLKTPQQYHSILKPGRTSWPRSSS